MISMAFHGHCNPVGIAINSKNAVFSKRPARTGPFGRPLNLLTDSARAPHLSTQTYPVSAMENARV